MFTNVLVRNSLSFSVLADLVKFVLYSLVGEWEKCTSDQKV